ncbi:ring-infected erythrocyte surface antigen-like [Dendrobium catenatum]|uniref:ring-infected erythrocyte surface antigen-like n=1 Tax=Dendrobium catenatum TaxID=906689 RepID=UPI0009F407F4|nr:ring-infected erythrocyte surface antigen-like [Dendrobium catenatum]
MPNQEPEIQWRLCSEIRVLEENIDDQNIKEEEYLEGGENIEENMEENIKEYMEENLEEGLEEINNAMDMEVVYMVTYIDIDDGANYDDNEDEERWQQPPRQVYRRRRREGSTIGRSHHSQEEEEEVEEIDENPSDAKNVTLAEMR